MSNVTTLSLSAIDVFRLDGSLWTGEAALRPEDLDPSVRAALPPKELASLGRKRVYPKGPLETLRAVRYRAYMGLRRLGVSIFDGAAYAVDPAVSPRAVDMLSAVKADFEKAKADFVDAYEVRFGDWLAGVDPQWRPAIRSALPPVQDMERRIRFGWQQFKLAEPSAPPAPGDTLAEEISSLGDSVFDQLADAAKISWNRQNNGLKDAKSWKRGIPDSVAMLIEKARNCSLFDPRLAVLAGSLQAAADAACVAEPSATDLCIFKGFLLAVQNPAAVKELCERTSGMFTEAADIGAAAGFMPVAPEPAPAAPEPALDALLAEADAAVEALSALSPAEPLPASDPEPEEIDPELAALLGL